MANQTLSGIIEVAAKLTGRRYCSHHGSETDALAGSVVVRNKSKRWMCFSCQERSAKRTAEIRAQVSAGK